MPQADRAAEPKRLLVRAIAAARRSLGATGACLPEGCAVLEPASRRCHTLGGPFGPLPGDRAGPGRLARRLADLTPGARLAFAVEPRSEWAAPLAAAGVTEILVGTRHPDPAEGGRFVGGAQQAGLRIRVADDERAAELLEPYARAMTTGRAYVVLKMATSLDGRIATRTGESQWITGPAARAAGRRLRSTLPAILVGVRTVISDDPNLTARRTGASDPVRVVLDSRLRTPPSARLVRTAAQVPSIILTTSAGPARARRDLEARGVEVVELGADRQGRVSVREAVVWLRSRSLLGVLVEGGGQVHGAFLDAGLVDRLVWFGAPMILGGAARPAVAGRGPAALADASRFVRWTARRIGADLMVDARAPPTRGG